MAGRCDLGARRGEKGIQLGRRQARTDLRATMPWGSIVEGKDTRPVSVAAGEHADEGVSVAAGAGAIGGGARHKSIDEGEGVRSGMGMPDLRRTSMKVGDGDQPKAEGDGDPEVEYAQISRINGIEGPASEEPGLGDLSISPAVSVA